MLFYTNSDAYFSEIQCTVYFIITLSLGSIEIDRVNK